MEIGDIVIVDQPRHPFYGLTGKIVGRRGEGAAGDPWLLIYVPSRMRSFLVPQSMLCMKEDAAGAVDLFSNRPR